MTFSDPDGSALLVATERISRLFSSLHTPGSMSFSAALLQANRGRPARRAF